MVSIVIPVYNVEKYIRKCLNSCLSQIYENIEIVVVNDGSTDSSGKILDEYAAKEPRIKVIHQTNKGVVYARELALENSTGEYVCFVDGDDFIENEMIGQLLKVAEAEKSDIVSCDFYICNEFSENKRVFKNRCLGNRREDALISLLLRKCTWSLCGKLFKRELFRTVKMPYGLKIGEDGLVCFQAYNNSCVVSNISQPYYNYIQRNSSVTHAKDISSSLPIIRFIQQIVQMKEQFQWGGGFDTPVNTFIASQLFVYYVNDGDLALLKERVKIPFTTWEMLNYDLRMIEKVGLFFFLRINTIGCYLRRLYFYVTNN